MKKVIISLSIIAAVAAVVVGGTTAFFSDEEVSTGNTFTAGALDLKVDNTCYYNKLADGQPNCPNDKDIVTSWEQTDLGPSHKFFWFDDLKPGDFGEDTVSLHVDNDAWMRMLINIDKNADNGCNEPELEAETACKEDDNGELLDKLVFKVWLDQGVTPGFQGPQDLSECDNDLVAEFEPVIISEGTVQNGESWALDSYQGAYLKGGETACFGIAWRLPKEVGNEVQTDGVEATMTFNVEQHRNNPTPSWAD